MKTGLQDRRTGSQRDRVAPDNGPMTGSSNYQQPSTIRGEAQSDAPVSSREVSGVLAISLFVVEAEGVWCVSSLEEWCRGGS